MASGIYLILNLANCKMYIGSAVNINKRWIKHLSLLNTNKHSNCLLQNAWNKYGNNNFQCLIIQYVDDLQNLTKVEQSWLNAFSSFDKEIGYNVSPIAGSSLGRKHTEESKKKISAFLRTRKGSKLNYSPSPERRKQMSEVTKAY